MERLGQLGAQRSIAERGLEPLGVSDHPDLRNLRNALQHRNDVRHQRPSAQLQIGLALAAHRLCRAPIPSSDDRGNTHPLPALINKEDGLGVLSGRLANDARSASTSLAVALDRSSYRGHREERAR